MSTTNPCFSCCAGVVTPPNTPCPPGQCICFCDIYISPKDAVAVPCTVEGSINLTDYPNDTTVCDAALVKFVLMYHDENFFSSVTLSEAGSLSWTPAANAPTVTGNLVFKILCGDLAKLVTVTIGRKSNCTGVVCGPDEYCSDCSGNCIPKTTTDFDLTVDIT